MENLAGNYEDKIRKLYQKILEREPDKPGLEHYLELLKQKTLTIPKLEQELKNSEEYKIKFLRPRNLDLPTLERMKNDWNLRAEVDANYYVAAWKTEK